MSKRGTALMWTVAVGSGLAVAFGLYQHMAKPSMVPSLAQGSVTVVVANEPLARGTVLTLAHLTTNMLPSLSVPISAFTDPRSLTGRLVKAHIDAGDPILEASLAPADHRPLLALRLAPGYRAAGVSVDPRGGIQRLLQIGDHVDVVVTLVDDEGVTSSKVLLQDLEVLAVPESADEKLRRATGTGGVPVTLAVVPHDAEKLALAMHLGTIQLLVRGYADDQPTRTSGSTTETLFIPSSTTSWQSPDETHTARVDDPAVMAYQLADQGRTP